jgi:hypothetical protein
MPEDAKRVFIMLTPDEEQAVREIVDRIRQNAQKEQKPQ